MAEQPTATVVLNAAPAEPCHTCNGIRMVNDADAGMWKRCPDCTREQFVKLPTWLVPTLARPFNQQEMDCWVVGAFLARFVHQNEGVSPSLAQLARIAGRDERSLMPILERMQRQGWIGMAKIRNEYEPGRFGLKWRFWLVGSSPLRDLMGRSSKPFVPVPTDIARGRSPIAVGLYLALHEQQRIDGAIVTTPTELAGLLLCSPRTVRRQLVAFGCEAVVTPVPGHAVYTMSRWQRIRPSDEVLACATIGGQPFRSFVSSQKVADGLQARAAELCELMERGGHGDELQLMARQLQQPSSDGDYANLIVALRVIEDRYRTRLVLDSGYRRRLWSRFSSRLKHTRIDRAVKAARADRRAFEQERDAALQTLARECPDCRGDRLVEHPDGRWGACSSCT